jgi:hypothetical protein
MVILANKPWQRFSSGNGSQQEGSSAHVSRTPRIAHLSYLAPIKVGTHFYTACQALNAWLPEGTLRIEESIKAVSKGSLPDFSFDYPRHSAQAQR